MTHSEAVARRVGVEISCLSASVKFKFGRVVDNLNEYAFLFLNPAGIAESVCLRIVEKPGENTEMSFLPTSATYSFDSNTAPTRDADAMALVCSPLKP